MKNKIALWVGMMLVCMTTMAQKVSDLLPKPQQVSVSGGAFTMGKVSVETPVMQSEWNDFVQQAGGEAVEKASKKIVVKLLPEIEGAKLNQEEAYRLTISSKGIQVDATTENKYLYLFFVA